jgi:hypothetical protein
LFFFVTLYLGKNCQICMQYHLRLKKVPPLTLHINNARMLMYCTTNVGLEHLRWVIIPV